MEQRLRDMTYAKTDYNYRHDFDSWGDFIVVM